MRHGGAARGHGLESHGPGSFCGAVECSHCNLGQHAVALLAARAVGEYVGGGRRGFLVVMFSPRLIAQYKSKLQ